MDTKLKSKITRFSQAIRAFVGYDEKRKTEFASATKAILKEIVAKLGVDAPIRYNAAGIAVSGDVTAHGDAVYITVSAESRDFGIMVRGCKGRRDYSGLANQWVRISDLEREFENDLPTFRRALADGQRAQLPVAA